MSQVTVLVGAQWGDEGKGKWVDILSRDIDLIARYQGGNNAGHTIYIDGRKIVLHQIPSGIFHPHQRCALTAGVVVNPGELVLEIKKLVHEGIQVTPERLWLSARAHVITPWNIYLDGKREAESDKPIGTTKRGIGPTYAEKAARLGLRLGDYIKPERRQQWLQAMEQRLPEFKRHREHAFEAWQQFEDAAEPLSAFVIDAEDRLRQELRGGKKLLLEGAQGILLDIDHGTYPYVTSSSTSSGGAFASLGFHPRAINRIIGVAKAYATRVGEGPFPTELNCETGKLIAERGREFGATTGRPRRCGWLDAVALRYAAEVGGFDDIILNKMDILSELAEIKVAVAYKHPTLGTLTSFPWDHRILVDCEPVYETFPGWQCTLPATSADGPLPERALQYVKAVAKATGTRISMVGTGVGRENAIFLD